MAENNLSLVYPANSTNFSGYSGYTMCPNWIYDTVLVEESASVAKVVLYINRNTTGRTTNGQRLEAVQASYGVIAREMNMSIRAVGDAVRTALAKGYLIQVKKGHAATEKMAGEGGWYALNWQWSQNNTTNYVKLEIVAPVSVSTPAPAKTPMSVRIEVPGQVPVLADRQFLPVTARQFLPPNKNKADSESNKKIELMDAPPDYSERISHINSTFNSTEPSTQKVKRPGSSAIGRLITDLTREFGDKASLSRPNISRTLNLWQQSGLAEKEFVICLYQARQKVLSSTTTIQHKRLASDGQVSDYPNRMPYFFRVLENLLEHPDKREIATATPAISETVLTIMPDPVPESPTFVEPENPLTEPTLIVVPSQKLPEPAIAETVPEAIKSWADQWSVAPEITIENWQTVLSLLEVSLSTWLKEHILAIAQSEAHTTLLAAVGLTSLTPSVTNIILLVRNAFEGRYLSRYLTELAAAFRQGLGWEVAFHFVIL